MNEFEHKRFLDLRREVADYIEWYLKEDCGHKTYEGTWDLFESYPSYFEDETAEAPPDFCKIMLHCYVLGPGRHYDWSGNTWNEALSRCEKDIKRWIREDMERK